VDEAAWLLGVQIVLRLVPGAGDSILQVLAGEAGAVAKGGRQACESAWLYHVPRRAGLVVAAIEGGPQEQTWENFGRALSVALAAVEDEGAIVLCTDLQRAPGPALRRLAEAEDDPAALRHIRRERSPDAVSASLLLEARQRAQVFLLSGLDEETVEDLGVGYVTAVDEIDRLCEQYESCVLLGDAHRAAVALS
jgi:nickel-dependent lactate racemase